MLVVFSVMKSFFLQLPIFPSALQFLYQNLPALGHGLSVVLGVLENQEANKCKVHALQALLAFSKCDKDCAAGKGCSGHI